jgi:hypothetical protein
MKKILAGNEATHGSITRMQMRVMKLRDMEYVKMQNTAADLWARLEKDSHAVRKMRAKSRAADEGLGPMEPRTPQQLINAVRDATVMQVPSMAGQRLMDLAIIANKAWLEHFKDKPSIKSDPAAIFEKLLQSAHFLRVHCSNLKLELCNREAKELKLQSELRATQSKLRKLERQQEITAERIRGTAGVPRSQHPALLATLSGGHATKRKASSRPSCASFVEIC